MLTAKFYTACSCQSSSSSSSSECGKKHTATHLTSPTNTTSCSLSDPNSAPLCPCSPVSDHDSPLITALRWDVIAHLIGRLCGERCGLIHYMCLKQPESRGDIRGERNFLYVCTITLPLRKLLYNVLQLSMHLCCNLSSSPPLFPSIEALTYIWPLSKAVLIFLRAK